MKQTKKMSAGINERILTTPKTVSFCLNATIPLKSGKNRNAIKPMEAPVPCIFEATVTMSFCSFTLNMPHRNPAPAAKIPIESDSKTVFNIRGSREVLDSRLPRIEAARYSNHDERICYYELLLEGDITRVPQYELPENSQRHHRGSCAGVF